MALDNDLSFVTSQYESDLDEGDKDTSKTKIKQLQDEVNVP
jgi:hypothetical protein